MKLGEGHVDVTLHGRVLVAGTQPFLVVGCVVDDAGELVDDELYGPPDTSFRRFSFVTRHKVIKVKCKSNCRWQYLDFWQARQSDPVDPVPIEVPVRMQQGPSVSQQIQTELLVAERRKREASMTPDSFMPWDSDDDEPLSEGELTELLIAEAMEEDDGKVDTEVEAESSDSKDGSSDGKKGTGKGDGVSEGSADTSSKAVAGGDGADSRSRSVEKPPSDAA